MALVKLNTRDLDGFTLFHGNKGWQLSYRTKGENGWNVNHITEDEAMHILSGIPGVVPKVTEPTSMEVIPSVAGDSDKLHPTMSQPKRKRVRISTHTGFWP